jgi:hypothetical protein
MSFLASGRVGPRRTVTETPTAMATVTDTGKVMGTLMAMVTTRRHKLAQRTATMAETFLV